MKTLLSFLLIITLSNLTIAQPNIEWQKCLGGTGSDYASSIQQTTDGGYIVAGYSTSSNGDVTGNHGDYDMWIVKLTNTGSVTWQKCLGGLYDDYAVSIQQTTDGGYIVAGSSESSDGDVTGNHGSNDMWVVKLTSTGTVTWQKCLGGTGSDYASSIQQTTDGGYIVAGGSESSDGDVTGNHGSIDMWVVKLTSTGTVTWQKCLGGLYDDHASSIQQTSDGGYIVAGGSNSFVGWGNHGNKDFLVFKLDSIGNKEWKKYLGGSSYDSARSIKQTSDGGYIVVGESRSNDGDVSGNNGYRDMWIVKLTSWGGINWQKSLGGSNSEFVISVQQTSDGGYVVAGSSDSYDGDITSYHGSNDMWIVKLSSTLDIDEKQILQDISIYPNPTSHQLSVDTELAINEINVIDITGKTIKTINQNTNTLDVADLTAGIYFIKLITNERTITKKFVKN